MKSARFRLILILICMLLIGVTFLLDIVGSFVPIDLVVNTVGIPRIVTLDREYYAANITQIVADEQYIYVLSGHNSITQVYTLGGDYQYSISVYNHSNGRTKIAAKDNVLYVCDKIDNLYLFSNGKFIEFIDRSESAEIRHSINLGTSDSAYFIKGGSVWRRINETEEICVIERPAILGFYQGSVSWVIKMILLMIIGYALYLPSCKSKANT